MDQDEVRAHVRRTALRAGAVVVAAGLVLGACTGPQDDRTGVASTAPPATATSGSGATSGDAQTDAPAPAPDLPTEPSRSKDAPEPLDPVERKTAKPVPIDKEAKVAKGVLARIVKVDEVDGEASLPGEIAGDALRVTVSITNDRDEALDLTSAIVNLFHGADDTPATTLSGPGAEPFPTTVAAGEKASGTYVFRVVERDVPVHVEVDVAADLTVVAFEGDA